MAGKGTMQEDGLLGGAMQDDDLLIASDVDPDVLSSSEDESSSMDEDSDTDEEGTAFEPEGLAPAPLIDLELDSAVATESMEIALPSPVGHVCGDCGRRLPNPASGVTTCLCGLCLPPPVPVSPAAAESPAAAAPFDSVVPPTLHVPMPTGTVPEPGDSAPPPAGAAARAARPSHLARAQPTGGARRQSKSPASGHGAGRRRRFSEVGGGGGGGGAGAGAQHPQQPQPPPQPPPQPQQQKANRAAAILRWYGTVSAKLRPGGLPRFVLNDAQLIYRRALRDTERQGVGEHSLLLASLEHALRRHLFESTRPELCQATAGPGQPPKVQLAQLATAALVVARQNDETAAPSASRVVAHYTAQLCEELLKSSRRDGKSSEHGAKSSAARNALWIKAAVAAAERAVLGGYGRDQPPLAFAAAITLMIFERNTPFGKPKTAPNAAQVAEAAAIPTDALMRAYEEVRRGVPCADCHR